MENKPLFLKAEEISKILGISRSLAYEVIKKLNSELEKKGYLTFNGRVSRKFFEERIYGMSSKGD